MEGLIPFHASLSITPTQEKKKEKGEDKLTQRTFDLIEVFHSK